MSTPDESCRLHGIARHVTVHEGSHAVYALDRGIDFASVTFFEPAHWAEHVRAGIYFMPGGVIPHIDEASAWFSRGPESALDFIRAGSWGEDQILGHHFPDGFSGDIKVFQAGLGKVMARDAAAQLNKESKLRVKDDWEHLRPHVERLAEALVSRVESHAVPGDLVLCKELVKDLAGL